MCFLIFFVIYICICILAVFHQNTTNGLWNLRLFRYSISWDFLWNNFKYSITILMNNVGSRDRTNRKKHEVEQKNKNIMGGWALEVGKMALYMTFPVALFHFFNQPAYFEKWVTDTKRELYPPENENNRKELQETIKMIRARREEQQLRELEEMESKRKRNA